MALGPGDVQVGSLEPPASGRTDQLLGWAIGYSAIALPIAAGVFEPVTGLVLRPPLIPALIPGRPAQVGAAQVTREPREAP